MSEGLDQRERVILAAEVNAIAQPLTMLALMWLLSNPDPDWHAGPMREAHRDA